MEEATSGLSRRGLLKSSLIVGLGAAGLSAASTAVTAGVAQASQNALVDIKPDYKSESLATVVQTQWAYCNQCRNVWYTAEGGNACSEQLGGPHRVGSSTDYGVLIDNTPGFTSSPPSGHHSGYQSPWNWCDQCSCLWYGPDQLSSYCPVAGQSTSQDVHSKFGSGVYYMPYGVETNGGAAWTMTVGGTFQQGWKYCSNCKCLYWGNAQSASWCQYQIARNFAGQPVSSFAHATGSTVYYLAMMG